MPFRRDEYPTLIADQLTLLASMLKNRSRARLTDANHSLETVMRRFFNALYGLNLVDLSKERLNYPAADLGDRTVRVAMQITNESAGSKITQTAVIAAAHNLVREFDQLTIFFLLNRKPSHPKGFYQPKNGPHIECLDITDLLKEMQTMDRPGALERAHAVLKEELSAGIEATPLERYLVTLHENFCTYENVGLPPPANAEGEKDVPLPIGRLFVTPTCTSHRVSPKEFDEALRGGGESKARPLLPLLAQEENRRTVLLADPGMGKSTLVQWLIATLAAREALPPEAISLRGAIPLPFILRDLVHLMPKDSAQWDWPALLDAFRRYHPRSAAGPALASAICGDEAQFNTILNSDRAFFLIDGLDEIGDPNHRRALRNALWTGFDRYPFARWLVTSRIVGYEEAVVHSKPWSRETMPIVIDADNLSGETVAHIFYLAPFDDLQQLAFAENWYVPRLGNVTGKQRAAGFVKAVDQHPSVRVIGRVPNLLYLLALLYRHKAHLPNGRALVYAAISEAYLEGIDLDRHLDGHQTVPYKLTEKIRFLAIVARHMQERRAKASEDDEAREILVSRTDLENWLAPLFPGEDGRAALHTFVGYVAARSGLLLPRGKGLFGFAHLSFQEYYAACWLEDEFRRLLNAANGTGFLRRRPTESGSVLTRGDFSTLATQNCWLESMIFLVEKLSANSDDTLTLVEWLFPQLTETSSHAKEENPAELMPITAARLLATLSLDPQVSLNLEQRKSIWSVLWQAHVEQSKTNRWNLAPALLSNSEFEMEVFSSLIQYDLKELNLEDCPGVIDLSPLAGLTQLESLDLSNCQEVVNLQPLACLTQLRSLDLRYCAKVIDLQPLAALTQLQNLDLTSCVSVADLHPLAGLIHMQSLDLTGCVRVVNLRPLVGLTQLRSLNLRFCDKVADLQHVAGLTQLESLDLMNCYKVVDLRPLATLTKLRSLNLMHCNKVVDLQPLAGLAQLELLNLFCCGGVFDLKPLIGLMRLRKLDIQLCGVSETEAFWASRPDLRPLSV